MIKEIIEQLQSANHYNVGEYIEIAKGRDEYIYKWKDFKRKLIRLWQLKE